MYGLWEYLLKAKALAPINAGRLLKGGWYLKYIFAKQQSQLDGTRLKNSTVRYFWTNVFL